MHNTEDWALSVGITSYPGINGLAALEGAETDARDFHSWVTEPTGGGVPANQAKLSVSSEFIPPRPPYNGRAPSRALVDEWLRQIAHTNGAGRAGRRLYLYFSCHGFAPGVNDVACLMADATELMFSHVYGNGWADDFYKLGKFDEIVLFADCCRTSIAQAPLMGTGLSRTANQAGIEDRKRFYGLAAPVTQTAMQVPDHTGKPRGIFTMALLDGLRGKAADPSTGSVGSASLKKFLYNFTKEYLPADLRAHEDKISPKIADDGDPNKQIIFCTPTAGNITVKIDISSPAGVPRNASVKVFSTGSGPVPNFVADTQVQDGVCSLDLACGHYLTLFDDKAFTLEVTPKGTWKIEDV